MSEIKPVYQAKASGYGHFLQITEDHYKKIADIESVEKRILYPAAALEALQAENAKLKWEKDTTDSFAKKSAEHATKAVADLKAETEAQAKEIQQWKTALECNETVRGEQAKRIAELELSAIRYEKLRRLNALQFQNIFKQNITSCARFDDLVDGLSAQKGTE
jgi:hypothetical protein